MKLPYINCTVYSPHLSWALLLLLEHFILLHSNRVSSSWLLFSYSCHFFCLQLSSSSQQKHFSRAILMIQWSTVSCPHPFVLGSGLLLTGVPLPRPLTTPLPRPFVGGSSKPRDFARKQCMVRNYITRHKSMKQTVYLEFSWKFLTFTLHTFVLIQTSPSSSPMLSHPYFGALRWL